MYHFGKGVEVDYPTCIEFYKKAAEDNYPLALNNLGAVYYNAMGVPKDYKKAFDLFLRAAERGIEEAQFTVASMLFHGTGVDIDIDKDKAKLWFKKAAQQGSAEAKKYLDSWI